MAGSLTLLFVRKLSSEGILFDQIIQVAIVVNFLILMFFLTKILRKKKQRELTESIHFLITASLLFIFLSTSTLVNIDRSRSFYIISWVNEGLVTKNQGGRGYSFEKVESEEKFAKVQIESRLREQIERGVINAESRMLELTYYGHIYLKVANFLAKTYKLEGWAKNKY
jgi:hypothetical protein